VAILELETLVMRFNSKQALILSCGVAAVIMTAAASLIIPGTAVATQQFATQTGKSCADCHTNPKGGGALTAFGEKFKANGNKLPN
jgi:hypothetical protein